MLTRRLPCPSCNVKLRVAETLPVGKQIECPKCGHGFPVPGEDEPIPTTKAAAVRMKKSAPPPEDEEIIEEFEAVEELEEVEKRPAPRKRKGRPAQEEVEDEDELAERRAPRKRRKQPKKPERSNALILGVISSIGVLVIGAAIIVLAVFRPWSKQAPEVAAAPAQGGMASVPGPGTSGPALKDAGPAASGRQVFEAHCTRCHTAAGVGTGRRGPDLSAIGKERSADWIMKYVRDPKSTKADSKMPSFGENRISDADLRALAEYLASLK